MRALPLLLLALSAATIVAAPSAASAATVPAPAPAAAPRAKPYWLKTYSMAPYRETWSGDLSVKKLDAAVPKVVEAVEKNGGRLTQPLENFIASATEKQIALVVPMGRAKDLLKALRKIGKAADPVVRPIGAPIPLAEVREKLARIGKERAENKIAFGQLPVAAEAVDEIIEHLANVEAVGRNGESEVLWNLTVKEAR